MDSKLLYAFIEWAKNDTQHLSKLGSGATDTEVMRALEHFALANEIERPENYDGVVMPDYDF